MRAVFWISSVLLVYVQAGYALLLALLVRAKPAPVPPPAAELPTVTVVVAAHREEDVIAARIHNLRALDYPKARFEIVVACDGSPDATPERAREAGADRVLVLPRGGKIRAQDAAVRESACEIVAFSDANSEWEPDALTRLVTPFEDPDVAYACGRVSFVNPEGGTNQEGLYWRYEMWVRERESALHSVTAGNGAIYAVRRGDYVEVDPVMGHDLSLPHTLVRRGKRAVDVAGARATERMVPDIEGEAARKRRMMSHTWAIVLRGGLLSPKGVPPRYYAALLSHRGGRYATPFLHLAALASSLVLTKRRPRYAVAAAAQLAVLVAPVRLARYYVRTTASIALGLVDYLQTGVEAGWDPAEGTR